MSENKYIYEIQKPKLAEWAENFFIRMNDEKHRRQDEWNTMLYRLDRRVIRKTLKAVNPFIQEQNGGYEIIHDVNGKIEIVFSSQSMRKAFKRWKFYERMKRWQSEPPYDKWNRKLIMVANGKRLRVDYWLCKEEINDFFGKRSKDFCQKLFKIGEWTYAFLRHKRNKKGE